VLNDLGASSLFTEPSVPNANSLRTPLLKARIKTKYDAELLPVYRRGIIDLMRTTPKGLICIQRKITVA
jgi:hypothetical protein